MDAKIIERMLREGKSNGYLTTREDAQFLAEAIKRRTEVEQKLNNIQHAISEEHARHERIIDGLCAAERAIQNQECEHWHVEHTSGPYDCDSFYICKDCFLQKREKFGHTE